MGLVPVCGISDRVWFTGVWKAPARGPASSRLTEPPAAVARAPAGAWRQKAGSTREALVQGGLFQGSSWAVDSGFGLGLGSGSELQALLEARGPQRGPQQAPGVLGSALTTDSEVWAQGLRLSSRRYVLSSGSGVRLCAPCFGLWLRVAG